MRIFMVTDSGDELDITEGVKVLYDLMHESMDFGSGFLDMEEVNAARKIAYAAGWEPITYALDVCTCGHKYTHHQPYAGASTCAVSATRYSEHYGYTTRECSCEAFTLDTRLVPFDPDSITGE